MNPAVSFALAGMAEWAARPLPALSWAPAAFAVAEAVALALILLALVERLVDLAQLLIAAREIGRRRDGPSHQLWRRYAESAPPISLLAPAYNEAPTIEQSVRSLLSLRYPVFEVVVVNDGSTDGTLEVLKRAFGLRPSDRFYDEDCPCRPIRGIWVSDAQPRLVVVDKENGGKADALNAGVNLSRAPVFCSIDADSLLEPDALLRAVRPFIESPELTLAVGGTVRVVNGCAVAGGRVVEVRAPRTLLPLLQAVEYLRAFLLARLAWSGIGALMIVSGAFGLFQRAAVVSAGGYAPGTVGEDMELVVRLHRWARDAGRPYRIAFVPEPVCWTEAPATLAALGRQRTRWQRGTLETFARHRGMLLRRRYGRVGTLGLGAVLLTDVIGPLADLLGWILIPLLWLLGLLSWPHLLGYAAVSGLLGVVVSIAALSLEEQELRRYPRVRDLLRLAGAAVLESFGYRQLIAVWRLRGLWRHLRGGPAAWGEMPRAGFAARAR